MFLTMWLVLHQSSLYPAVFLRSGLKLSGSQCKEAKMNLVLYSKRLNKFPIKDQQMAKFFLQ